MKEALNTTEALYHGLHMVSQNVYNAVNQLNHVSPPLAQAMTNVAHGMMMDQIHAAKKGSS